MKLFEFLPDVFFFVKNMRSEFVYANAGFVEMLGARRMEDIAGKTDRDFSPRELADHFVRDDRQVMRSGQPMVSRVELVPHADRGIGWHVTTKVPVRDGRGRVIGVAGFTRDLTRSTVTAGRYREMALVMEYMDRHYPESITARELAALAHLSLSQFERRFRALFQVTPMKYLIRLRLNKACQMLAGTSTKITEIALQCGFYDHSHFIRQFSAMFGMPPSAFRRQHTRAAEGSDPVSRRAMEMVPRCRFESASVRRPTDYGGQAAFAHLVRESTPGAVRTRDLRFRNSLQALACMCSYVQQNRGVSYFTASSTRVFCCMFAAAAERRRRPHTPRRPKEIRTKVDGSGTISHRKLSTA